jgi:hypothetical protein
VKFQICCPDRVGILNSREIYTSVNIKLNFSNLTCIKNSLQVFARNMLNNYWGK